MANIVYIATSLDGYIARKDGNIDWLMEIPNPDNSDYGFSTFMKRIDGIIMGRKTFEVVLDFGGWPYSKPVYILSNSMTNIPEDLKERAKIVKGELKEIIGALNKKGFKNLYIDGGKTIQSFLNENLIDELIITRIPIILGSGIPLFDKMDIEIRFEHIQTEIYKNGLIKSRYTKKK